MDNLVTGAWRKSQLKKAWRRNQARCFYASNCAAQVPILTQSFVWCGLKICRITILMRNNCNPRWQAQLFFVNVFWPLKPTPHLIVWAFRNWVGVWAEVMIVILLLWVVSTCRPEPSFLWSEHQHFQHSVIITGARLSSGCLNYPLTKTLSTGQKFALV